jgi:hypothetical protein
MKFFEVRAFFESWGMFPSDEEAMTYEYMDTYGHPHIFNKNVVDNGMNYGCYNKMLQEAIRLEDGFCAFISTCVEAQDDAWYLNVSTWDQLSNLWTKTQP